MINKKIASEIGVGVVLLTAIVIGGIFWMQNKSISKIQNTTNNNSEIQKPVAQVPAEKKVTMCTQDAKLCEDGKTYVGRSGENCEFAPCPNEVVTEGENKISPAEDNGTQNLSDNNTVNIKSDLDDPIVISPEIKAINCKLKAVAGKKSDQAVVSWSCLNDYGWKCDLKRIYENKSDILVRGALLPIGSKLAESDSSYYTSETSGYSTSKSTRLVSHPTPNTYGLKCISISGGVKSFESTYWNAN